MNKFLLSSVVLLTAPFIHAQSIWSGQLTINSSTAGVTGTADFEVNTTTNTMVLSNKQGVFLTRHGLSNTTTLYAMSDFSTPANTLVTTGSYDVTDAHFNVSTAAGLGVINNDGWYWVSAQSSDLYTHLMIGAKPENGPAGALADYSSATSSNSVAFASSAPNGGGDINLGFTNATASPEPSSTALLGLGALGLLARRKRS